MSMLHIYRQNLSWRHSFNELISRTHRKVDYTSFSTICVKTEMNVSVNTGRCSSTALKSPLDGHGGEFKCEKIRMEIKLTNENVKIKFVGWVTNTHSFSFSTPTSAFNALDFFIVTSQPENYALPEKPFKVRLSKKVPVRKEAWRSIGKRPLVWIIIMNKCIRKQIIEQKWRWCSFRYVN